MNQQGFFSLRLKLVCFTILIHGISDHIEQATTRVVHHVGLMPISLNALLITFRDNPFVNWSAKFLAVGT
jgi:hypothetical protein